MSAAALKLEPDCAEAESVYYPSHKGPLNVLPSKESGQIIVSQAQFRVTQVSLLLQQSSNCHI